MRERSERLAKQAVCEANARSAILTWVKNYRKYPSNWKPVCVRKTCAMENMRRKLGAFFCFKYIHEICHQKRFSHLHYLIVSAPNNRNGKQNEGFKRKKLCVLFATWQMFWKFMKVHIWRIRDISLYKLMLFCLIFHQSIHIKRPTYLLSLLNYQN